MPKSAARSHSYLLKCVAHYYTLSVQCRMNAALKRVTCYELVSCLHQYEWNSLLDHNYGISVGIVLYRLLWTLASSTNLLHSIQSLATLCQSLIPISFKFSSTSSVHLFSAPYFPCSIHSGILLLFSLSVHPYHLNLSKCINCTMSFVICNLHFIICYYYPAFIYFSWTITFSFRCFKIIHFISGQCAGF